MDKWRTAQADTLEIEKIRLGFCTYPRIRGENGDIPSSQEVYTIRGRQTIVRRVSEYGGKQSRCIHTALADGEGPRCLSGSSQQERTGAKPTVRIG